MKHIFQLEITDKFTTTVEVMGQDKATEVVVFSHGFGVGRDSRGMFIDIEQELKSDYICVRFDYAEIQSNGDTKIESFLLMQKTLDVVVQYVQERYSPLTVHLVGHSLGGLVAMQHPKQFDGNIVLLAPPITPVADRLRSYFAKQPNTKVKDDGVMIAQRSDGTHTSIGANFWNQLQTIDPLDVYARVTKDIYVLQAREDEIVENKPELVKRIDSIVFSEIPGDHNFTGSSRELMLQYVRDIFYG